MFNTRERKVEACPIYEQNDSKGRIPKEGIDLRCAEFVFANFCACVHLAGSFIDVEGEGQRILVTMMVITGLVVFALAIGLLTTEFGILIADLSSGKTKVRQNCVNLQAFHMQPSLSLARTGGWPLFNQPTYY